jgi:hypothetical protein
MRWTGSLRQHQLPFSTYSRCKLDAASMSRFSLHIGGYPTGVAGDE